MVSTGSAEGQIAFWDIDMRVNRGWMDRISCPIVDLRFDPSGCYLAYAVGYDWHKGHSAYQKGNSISKVFVHPYTDDLGALSHLGAQTERGVWATPSPPWAAAFGDTPSAQM